MTSDPRPLIGNGLHWVRHEFDQSLTRARTLIEYHIENPADLLPLQQALVELHTVRGTANMIQCFGVSAAAEEMKKVLHEMMQGRIPETEAAYSALLGATVQVADYIDALSAGMDDCVLVLQPVLSELRLARGKALVTEVELFATQIGGLGLSLPLPVGERVAGAAQAEARKLLPLFQMAMLHWLRNDAEVNVALGRIGKIAEQIANLTSSAALHQFWRTAAAVVEALLTHALEDSQDLKRAMGASGQQIKLLAEEGENAAAARLDDLNYQLLFFVGRARGQGVRVSALRDFFRLASYLPPSVQIEERRQRIRGPGVNLLTRVAEEVRRDFVQVKDSIDLAVRSGGKSGTLEDTRARLQRIANTLATLGLPALARVVGNQSKLLEHLEANENANTGAALWMDVATSILRVELSLEDALFRQISRRSNAQGVIAELEEQTPHTRDLADSSAALLRESLVNIARLKTAVDTYVRGGDTAPAQDAQRLLGEIASGLQILQNERAAGLVRTIEHYVNSAAFAQLRDSKSRADRFADAVASIEYYIEAVRDNLPNAELNLADLSRYVEQLEVIPEAASAITLEQTLLVQPEAPVPEPVSMPAPVVVAAEDVDPEIRDIFLEEASEVLSTLDGTMPRLRRDAQDMESLTTARRAFHTLKGSGRMVGAQQIGEFGWAVENLLNRCLDGSVPAGPVVVEIVGEAVTMLPALIENFRNGTPPDAALQALIERAGSLAERRIAQVPDEPDMNVIFRDDAREKLDNVAAWLVQQDRSHAWFAVNADVVRAFHTLRGAAHVVSAPAVSELSGALEIYLDSTRGAGQELPLPALALIEDAVQTLRDWIDMVGTAAAAAQDAAPWLQRIRTLQSEVSEQVQQAAADRQLAEIFATEALDLVQKIEETAVAWTHAPENLQAAGVIKNLSHTLLGAALMSQCSPLAVPSRALNLRMAEALGGAIKPAPEFFAGFAGVVEAYYQLLDHYREGSLSDDGSALAAQIEALQWRVGQPEPIVAEAAAPEAALPVEDVIEMPPVADESQPGVEATQQSDEAELAAIFLGEARDLLENLDAYSAAWEENPYGIESGAEIRRVFHTLKGSALMAGYTGLGEVSARLQALVAGALHEGRPDAALFSRLHQASDGLHRALGEMERGRLPDLSALLADIDPEASAAEEPAILAEDYAPVEEQPQAVVEPPEPVSPAVQLAPAVSLPSADDELAEIFSGEAGELLETMQHSLNVWQRDPRELAPAREILRDLHTLKGGARMAGLNAMGNAAHDMESHINLLELRGSADDAALKLIAAELEALLHMHDLLMRGDTGGLRADNAPRFDDVDQTAAVVDAATASDSFAAAAPVTAEAMGWDPLLFWKPEEDQAGLANLRRETARVPVENLDSMLNEAGEISIYRSRLEEQHSALQAQLNEMSQAITRVREQLRMMDIETEAQISARGIARGEKEHRYEGDFDPLEMDRYTRMQELSRALSESIGDLSGLHTTMDGLVSEAETLLLQQARINTDVQQGLMRTLMVPFSRQVARLQRVVKQAAQDNGKEAEAQFDGIESELDRNVLERMTAPLEHLLRNAIVHGIEDPRTRIAAGKPPIGTVKVSLRREGTQLLVELSDDGKGLDFNAIRETAIKRGLMPADAEVADQDVAQFIFEPGFSTARKLTQDAGRGIGMDVVAAEVKQLGGTLEIGSETGKGARFLVRLPLNLAISQALLVSVAGEMYAVPLSSIEGIARIPREQLDQLYGEDGPAFNYGGHDYRVRYLGDFIGTTREAPKDGKTVSAILVRMGEGLGTQDRRIAVVVDALYGNREVVSKAVGPLINSVIGVSSATILADGRVVLILDVPALTQDRTRRALITMATGKSETTSAEVDTRELVMVVDDSITIRRVTERLLLKHGYRVSTAKDGLDAMARLQTEHPVAVLLDIEMPRADGFEVAAFIRNNQRIRNVPIIMITSRSGDKHRERAMQLGVNRYMIKPYQEEQLISEVRGVLAETGHI
jgi:chemosensory pili system protein ChpA (sensor histidine kinase/response regulator)